MPGPQSKSLGSQSYTVQGVPVSRRSYRALLMKQGPSKGRILTPCPVCATLCLTSKLGGVEVKLLGPGEVVYTLLSQLRLLTDGGVTLPINSLTISSRVRRLTKPKSQSTTGKA